MAKRTYYIMNRTGKFRPLMTTHNQCKEPGWPEYSYALRMVFPGDLKLDKNKFIVDHAQIHRMVLDMKPVGSCEEMGAAILNALDNFMGSKKIPMLACRCIIKATDPDAPAWMERIHVADKAPNDITRFLQ